MPKNASPITSAAVIHRATAYGYAFGTGSTRSSVQKNTYPGTISARYVNSRTVPLWNTAVYQDVKYITMGTAVSARAVIAGNVTVRATRLLTAACTPRDGAGTAVASSVSGFPMARNSGTTSTSSTVCVARA